MLIVEDLGHIKINLSMYVYLEIQEVLSSLMIYSNLWILNPLNHSKRRSFVNFINEQPSDFCQIIKITKILWFDISALFFRGYVKTQVYKKNSTIDSKTEGWYYSCHYWSNVSIISKCFKNFNKRVNVKKATRRDHLGDLIFRT